MDVGELDTLWVEVLQHLIHTVVSVTYFTWCVSTVGYQPTPSQSTMRIHPHGSCAWCGSWYHYGALPLWTGSVNSGSSTSVPRDDGTRWKRHVLLVSGTTLIPLSPEVYLSSGIHHLR